MNERFRSSDTVEKAEVDEKNLIFYTLMAKIVILWITRHLIKLKFLSQ